MQTVKARSVDPKATIWCHFVFSGTSLDFHVSCAQCLKTLFVKNESRFVRANLAGKVLLSGCVESDLWSASLRDAGVTFSGPALCLTEVELADTGRGTNLLFCFSERGGKSVWPGLILFREECALRAHSPTSECAMVRTSDPPSPAPPQSQPDQTPRST